jgi:hypothetical protein
MIDRPDDDLRRVENALSAIPAAQAEQYLGVRLMQQSLGRRRDQVVADLYGRLDLRITRDADADTGGELSLVGGVLTSLQESLASVAQVLAGQATARGLIPTAIKEEVSLRLLAAQPGSLNMQLVPVSRSQEPLFEGGEQSLLEHSMDRLLGLLDEAGGDESDLLQSVADLGPRVTTHVNALARWLADADATASLDWRSRALAHSTRLDTTAARHLRLVLEEVRMDTRDRVFAGRIVGGSLVRGTFEMELDDDAEKTVVGGRVHESALPDLERLFGRGVTALIEVREAQLHSGETRETHLLKSLSE